VSSSGLRQTMRAAKGPMSMPPQHHEGTTGCMCYDKRMRVMAWTVTPSLETCASGSCGPAPQRTRGG
jgi:hypothetical protein